MSNSEVIGPIPDLAGFGMTYCIRRYLNGADFKDDYFGDWPCPIGQK